jgi:hypothetical protein
LSFITFDAINHRVVYSRQGLQRMWSESLRNMRRFKLSKIHPWRCVTAMAKEFSLTTSFASSFLQFSKQSDSEFGPG